MEEFTNERKGVSVRSAYRTRAIRLFVFESREKGVVTLSLLLTTVPPRMTVVYKKALEKERGIKFDRRCSTRYLNNKVFARRRYVKSWKFYTGERSTEGKKIKVTAAVNGGRGEDEGGTIGEGRKLVRCIMTPRKIVDHTQIRSDHTCTVYYNLVEGLLADKFFI